MRHRLRHTFRTRLLHWLSQSPRRLPTLLVLGHLLHLTLAGLFVFGVVSGGFSLLMGELTTPRHLPVFTTVGLMMVVLMGLAGTWASLHQSVRRMSPLANFSELMPWALFFYSGARRQHLIDSYAGLEVRSNGDIEDIDLAVRVGRRLHALGVPFTQPTWRATVDNMGSMMALACTWLSDVPGIAQDHAGVLNSQLPAAPQGAHRVRF